MHSKKSIIDGLKVICICRQIKKKVFLKHIESGIRTVRGLKEITGAGSGPCGGKRCTPRIEEMLKLLKNTNE